MLDIKDKAEYIIEVVKAKQFSWSKKLINLKKNAWHGNQNRVYYKCKGDNRMEIIGMILFFGSLATVLHSLLVSN